LKSFSRKDFDASGSISSSDTSEEISGTGAVGDNETDVGRGIDSDAVTELWGEK